MYYARELFVKRGPLATLWLAGHGMRKVGKHQIVHANIEQMCGVVEHPPVALALPTQSTLLRGVCRIENKKAIYLLEDAESSTLRLIEPARAREATTLPEAKIRARPEAITFTDEEQAAMAREDMDRMPALDDLSMLVESTGDMDLLFGGGEDRLRQIDEAELQGRAEDITLTQDISQLGIDSLGDLGALDAEMELGDGFGLGGADLEAEAAGLPSPAISELAPAPGVELDLLTSLPTRRKAAKRKAYAPVIDEKVDEQIKVEITDGELRQQLHDTSDIVIDRPELPPPFVHTMSLQNALQMPWAANPLTHPTVPQSFVRAMERACKIVPVVDEVGHTAAEIEAELGGDAGWDVEAGFEAEEARAEELESIITGGEMEDLSRSLARGEVEEGEAVLFGTEEVSGAEIRAARARREVSGRFEVVSELETPEVGVPESQFEVPTEEVRVKPPRISIQRGVVNKHTEIFRHELEKKFARLARAKAPLEVQHDAFLSELVHGVASRRDGALAFYQLLVLKSLDIIDVTQDTPFGELTITKGPKWAMSFSASQMFSDTPSQ